MLLFSFASSPDSDHRVDGLENLRGVRAILDVGHVLPLGPLGEDLALGAQEEGLSGAELGDHEAELAVKLLGHGPAGVREQVNVAACDWGARGERERKKRVREIGGRRREAARARARTHPRSSTGERRRPPC